MAGHDRRARLQPEKGLQRILGVAFFQFLHRLAAHSRVSTMIRIELQLGLNYQVDAYGADFIFNIHAALTPHQTLAAESLVINQPVPQRSAAPTRPPATAT